MPASFNFEESYLALIVDTYEKGIMIKGDPKGYKLLMNKNVTDLKSVTSMSKKSVNSFPGSSYDLEKNPEDAKVKKKKPIDASLLKKQNIPLAPEALNDYIDRCFGCDLRLQWDWQFLPPDIVLDSLGGLMNEILGALEALKDVFNTKKRLEQICSLGFVFGGIPCPQDLLNIVFGLKMLLNKYISFGLNFRIDWFTILGPIITAIVNLVSYLVNFLFDALTGPLDCSIATMGAGLDLARTFNSEVFATSSTKNEAFADSYSETGKQTTGESVLGTDYENFAQTGASASASGTGIGSAGVDANASQSTQYKSVYSGGSKDVAIPSGTTQGLSISSFMNQPDIKKPKFMDLALPEQFFVAVVEAKDYVTFYKQKILEALDSLNGLVKGSKLLDIQNMSILILVAEMLSLMLQLLNTDFATLCDPQNKTKINIIVKSFVESTDDSLEVSITTSDLGDTVARITELEGVSEIILKPCSTANTAEDIKQVENILAEIEKLTHG